MANLLALDERHRALWSEVQRKPNLQRILAEEADLAEQPLSVEEQVCLRRIILQFETGWRLEKIMNRGELKALALDAADFFSLPLPRAIWERTKQYHNPKFVRFVERALSGHTRW